MNRYVKEFLRRGLMFGGFGPVVAGIVFATLGATLENFSLSGSQVLLATVSTYLLAFIHAGASVFNQIEHWPIGKSLMFHFLSLYIAYSVCYCVNSWIAFEPLVLLIFTAVFAAMYFAVWLTVYFSVKLSARSLNKKLK